MSPDRCDPVDTVVLLEGRSERVPAPLGRLLEQIAEAPETERMHRPT